MRSKIFSTIALMATAFLASCIDQRPYPVYFHTQASGPEEGARFIFMFNNTPYSRMPLLNLDHFQQFSSFITEDGSYGVELYLKPMWRTRLYQASIDHAGGKLLPVVNGLVYEATLFDRPITDGILVIWSGLNGYDLKQISKTVTAANPEIERARYLDKDPRPRPAIPKKKNQVRDANGRVIGELYRAEG